MLFCSYNNPVAIPHCSGAAGYVASYTSSYFVGAPLADSISKHNPLKIFL
jgi:hypothetical protein